MHCHATDRAPQVDVYTNHGIYPIHQEMPDWQRRANRAIFDNLRQARQVAAVSHWTAEQWGALVGRYPDGDPREAGNGDTWVLYNGIDLADWEDVPTGRLRAALSIPYETPMVLWGKTALSEVLDPTPALEIALRRPDVQVVIPLPQEALPHAPANVRLIGPQPFRHMQAALADCDVYLATVKENHAIQVLEAMALAKPVLGYRHGGTAETVGAGGVLVRPGDVGALLAGLDTALAQGAALGAAGRERVERRFTWEQHTERLLAVYERALAERASEASPGRPKVSVVIPCYNKAPYVGEAIQSVLAQRDAPPYELLVVDDGSTDSSLAAIAAALAPGVPQPSGGPVFPLSVHGVPVRVIRQENAGVAAARNNGIEAAQGRYICCLDADDRIDPLALARWTAALDADPGLGVAYSDMLVFGVRPDTGGWQSIVTATEYDFEMLKRGNLIPCCNLFRKSAWRRAGGYKDINPSWEDYELWLNMGKLGWHGRRVPGPLFHYRKLWREGRDHESQRYVHRLRAIVNSHHRDLYPPMVSVVIPCYQHSQFLAAAIDSALAQTWPDLEVVVVDDGNDPAEATAIGEIVDSYPSGWVRLVTNDRNLGLAAARNAGIDAARGAWIVPLDADDKLEPSWLETTLQAIQMDPRRFGYSDSILWWPAEGREQVLEASEYDFADLLNRITWPCTIIFHRDAWRQAGGYKPVMSAAGGWEDWEFCITLGEIGVCGVRAAQPLFRYRQHSAQQMRHSANGQKPVLQEMIRRLHPATYRGEFSMSCCGKRGSTPAPEAQVSRGATASVRGAAVDGNEPVVMVRYVGQSFGSQTWRAPSGRQYRFGVADPLRQVSQSDAEWFALRPEFQVVT
ncbi:MAG TPA: glycosyltransferase [Anaerolineae bacterium]|nr:glycosyltransferase [Anaerolineae bacterium]